MPLTLINKQVETELNDREWELFSGLSHYSEEQRDQWRQAWRAWRVEHLSSLLSGKAKLRIWIESGCIGCFDCEIMCPEVFEVNGKRSTVRKNISIKDKEHGPHIDPKQIADCLENIELAKEACPVEAIAVCISDPENLEPLPQDFR